MRKSLTKEEKNYFNTYFFSCGKRIFLSESDSLRQRKEKMNIAWKT